ncbi:MAG: hypothetical protein R3C26_00490 [Calditrichia bacterium]
MPLISRKKAGWTSMTNGWIGLRGKLAEKGIELETVLTGDMISNVSGGIASGSEWLNNIDIAMAFDGDELMGWPGATMFLYVLGNYGGSPATISVIFRVSAILTRSTPGKFTKCGWSKFCARFLVF